MEPSKLDKLKAQIRPNKLINFRLIDKLAFSRKVENEKTTYDLELRLVSDEAHGLKVLKFKCTNIKGLKLVSDGYYIGGLDIVDMRDRQNEGIGWEFFDYESQVVHFYCLDFEFEIK